MGIDCLIEAAVHRAVAPLVEEVRELRQQLGAQQAGDVLDLEGLRLLLGKPSAAATYQFLQRHPDLPVRRAGRRIMASRAEVQRWLGAAGERSAAPPARTGRNAVRVAQSASSRG